MRLVCGLHDHVQYGRGRLQPDRHVRLLWRRGLCRWTSARTNNAATAALASASTVTRPEQSHQVVLKRRGVLREQIQTELHDLGAAGKPWRWEVALVQAEVGLPRKFRFDEEERANSALLRFSIESGVVTHRDVGEALSFVAYRAFCLRLRDFN